MYLLKKLFKQLCLCIMAEHRDERSLQHERRGNSKDRQRVDLVVRTRNEDE